MHEQIIEQHANLDATWTKFDIRRLIAVSGVINWNNLNVLENAQIVIHPDIIINTKKIFIHKHNSNK